MMKKIVVPGLLAGVLLLIASYAALYLTVKFFPWIAEEYYNPMFSMEGDKAVMFFLHPFILAFGLAWFWDRFKGLFHGNFIWRGFEMGVVYGLIATLPSTWMTFSAISVSLQIVLTWFAYGLFQAVVAGIVFAKLNPE